MKVGIPRFDILAAYFQISYQLTKKKNEDETGLDESAENPNPGEDQPVVEQL
jgi:hypothetical protein